MDEKRRESTFGTSVCINSRVLNLLGGKAWVAPGKKDQVDGQWVEVFI